MRLFARHDEVVPDYPGGAYAVSRPWGEENRATVTAFLRALAAAMRWASDPGRRKAAADLVASAMRTDPGRAEVALSRLPASLDLDAKALAVPLGIRLRFGLTPPHGAEVESFLDRSYLEAALEG